MENHLSEMKGDVGISSHEKGETRTCLHVCQVSTKNRTMHYQKVTKMGMGLSMTSCLGIRMFLFPSVS